MRTPIIAGNWKMNKRASEAGPLVREIAAAAAETDAEVLVCPPFTALAAAADAAAGSRVRVGAQDLFWHDRGAYTGEIAPGMLLDLGVTHVILGHSERRGRFGAGGVSPELRAVLSETDAVVNLKLHAALRHGLVPIVCCGETDAERDAGMTAAVVSSQVIRSLAGLTREQAAGVVIAYEPVWAIGTGKVCSAGEADATAGVVRATVAGLFGAAAAEEVRVQYGGSVKPDNAAELMQGVNVDGLLVGGASLTAADFNGIIGNASGR